MTKGPIPVPDSFVGGALFMAALPFAYVYSKYSDYKNKRSEAPSLRYMKDEDKTHEICLRAVAGNPWQYQWVPRNLQKDNEITGVAIVGAAYNVERIPEGYQSKKTYQWALSLNGDVWPHLPNEYKNEEMLFSAIKDNLNIVNSESIRKLMEDNEWKEKISQFVINNFPKEEWEIIDIINQHFNQPLEVVIN